MSHVEALIASDRDWHPFSSVAFRLYGTTPTIDAALAVMRAASTQSLERMLEAP